MRLRQFAAICAGVIALSSLTGCVSMEGGREFDMSKAQSFQYGKTSRADIIAALGQPTTTGSSGEGTSITYTYSKSGSGLKNVAAMYGIGSIRSNSTIKTCVFTFDAHEKLKDSNCSETNGL